MELNELVQEAHGMACSKGWWNPAKSPLEVHMMIVSELAEATEACRITKLPAFYIDDSGKPQGEAVELADALIRIADYFGWKGWDMEHILKTKMSYNAKRGMRHGGKLY